MKMKKNILITSILILVFMLTSCTSGPQATPSSSQSASSGSTAPQGNAVSIQKFSFNPGTLTVKAGTTVVWTNNDSATHSIKSSSFNSPNLATGQTFEFKFDTKGTYDYSCGIHPTMTGQIVVE